MEFIQTNIVIIAVVSALALIIVYFIFKKDLETNRETEKDNFTIEFLKEGVDEQFNEITNQNLSDLYLNKRDYKKREQNKARVSQAIRSCAQGNTGEKNFMKDYIKYILQSSLKINEQTINYVIPFNEPERLTPQDKFEILYHQFSIQHNRKVFERLNDLCGFDKEKKNEFGEYYEITVEDINRAYDKYAAPLRYNDCLNVVVQRIYQEKYGFSVADILRDDETIDGISGGCSGISTEDYNYMEETFQTGSTKKSKSYNSMWIFFHGKAIRMSCLSFSSQNDLIRTCKNMYSYNTVGHLTSTNGYKLTYQYDGSRVVVVRPNLVTHWAFFVRKFDSAKHLTVDRLLTYMESNKVVEMMKWIVKGCLNAVISGDQNSGKTTCLKALGIFFDQRNPIRTTEPEFELWFNNIYDTLNCLCFRGNDELSLIESINLQKKTDAAIMLLGEVNSFELAAAYISLCQSGTKSTLCTCHCVSTDDMVDYFRNALLASGTIGNDVMTAEEQVANAVYIDIHWEKTSDGHRYINYINEIEPFKRYIDELELEPLKSIAESLKLLSRRRAFKVRELIALENGKYVVKNEFSDRSIKRIMRNLSDSDKINFLDYLKVNKGGI